MRGALEHGVAAALGLALGCGADVFACQSDLQCGGASDEGTCQPTGGCSFPDSSCESGQRYGEHAPPELAGECVEPSGATVATTDPPTTGTSLDSSTSSATTEPGLTSGESSTSTANPITATTSTSESSSTGEPLDPDLMIWLPFEVLDARGTPDASGNGFDAACASTGCPSQVDGPVGMAAQFDGANECLEIGHTSALDVDGPFTFAAWVRYSQLEGAASRTPLGKAFGQALGNSWQILFRQDLEPGPAWDIAAAFTSFSLGNAVSTEVGFDEDEWVHVAGTWDDGAAELFLGGTWIDSSTVGPAAFDDHGITIGCDRNFGNLDGWWDGGVDDVRFYTRVLAESEIAELAGL